MQYIVLTSRWLDFYLSKPVRLTTSFKCFYEKLLNKHNPIIELVIKMFCYDIQILKPF